MAVVPMQKVQVVVHRSDTDAVLDVLQQSGAMEFTEVAIDDMVAADGVFPHAQLLPRVQHAIGFLKPYEVKVSLWRTLRDGAQADMSEADVIKQLSDTDAVEQIVSDQEAVQVEFAEKTEHIRLLEEQAALLGVWSAVPMRLATLTTNTTYTKLIASGVGRSASEPLLSVVTNFLTEHDIPSQVTSVSADLCAITIATDAIAPADLQKQLEAIKLQVVATPKGAETADVELVAVQEQLATAKGELAMVHDQAQHFAQTHLRQLRIVGEVLAWERDRFATVTQGLATSSTVVFNGWMNAQKREAIETKIVDKKLAALVTDIEASEGEEPPVDIVNNSLIRPFEAVTRLYGMPGYRDLDPTIFLAGFFFLFFGLSLTDVGYGLFLVGISAFILFATKANETIKLFAKLLLFLGVSTVFVGMLFGGYFGIAPELLPAPLQAIQLFDPIANPLPVFYLALGLGVFQVMVGMVLKIYSESRQGRLLDGVLDQGPWLLLFTLGIMYVGVVTGYVSFVTTDTLVTAIYAGLVLLIVTAIRNSKSILEVLMNAGGSLYGSVGYLSDILSYSRLLALGLATTALAFAINLIAGIVYEAVPYVGAVFALLILFVGHAFTLAVNTLGAFIHSARLQFVEFFGKFIVGAGKEFKPLKRSEDYITVAKE